MSYSQANAEPIPATIGGKDYLVKLIRQDEKGKLEQACKKEVRETILEDKEHMSSEEYKLAYGAFLDRVGAGEYKFGGPTHQKWMESPAGLENAVAVCFGVSAGEAAALIKNYPDEVNATLKQVFSESFRPAPV